VNDMIGGELVDLQEVHFDSSLECSATSWFQPCFGWFFWSLCWWFSPAWLVKGSGWKILCQRDEFGERGEELCFHWAGFFSGVGGRRQAANKFIDATRWLRILNL